jgi:DNA-binding response OmpR family regulator
MLPDRSGYDICEELKLDRHTNLIPIIIVTARAQHEDKLKGLRVGANYYLTKPFAIDQLEDAIRKVLDWRGELERTARPARFTFSSAATPSICMS